ncbi:hypothetical protein [Mycolicibacterium sp. XJ1819]
MTGKLVYLARRNPTLSHEQFAKRWLKHSAHVGAGAPGALTEIRTARYCLVQSGVEHASDEYDGVGLLQLPGLNSIPTMHKALIGTEVSLADELRTFSTYVKDFTIYCDEEIVTDAEPSTHAVLHFVRRSPDIGPSAFADAWREYARRLAQSLDGVLGRQVLNHLIAPAPPGYGFDGVHELWCASPEQAAAITAELHRGRADTSDWLSPRTGVVLATETILNYP